MNQRESDVPTECLLDPFWIEMYKKMAGVESEEETVQVPIEAFRPLVDAVRNHKDVLEVIGARRIE